MERGISLLGLLAMLGIAWSLSTARSRIHWRCVLGGIFLQFVCALLILKTTPGRWLFDGIGDLFHATIRHVDSGSDFMFGISGQAEDSRLPPRLALLRTVAFGVLPTIVFFSSLMSILYYLGIMQKLTQWIAWIMQRTLQTSGAESLSAAANIFVGQTEAPLVVRPYLSAMTLSELNAVMVGGFATIAGGVMAFYVLMGIDAGHLVTASVISAPAALVIAKIMVPETSSPATLGHVQLAYEDPSANIFEAAAAGAADGMKMAINVAAMLIAFLALLSLGNGILGWLGDRWYDAWSLALGSAQSGPRWTLEGLLSYLFAPIAWLMGIPRQDCLQAGKLLGLRTAANEFLAYDGLSRWMSAPDHQPQPRTSLILTYALCGFANLGSVGIQIGGIGALVPERRSDLARLGLRAMIGGTLASLMTACIAGLLM